MLWGGSIDRHMWQSQTGRAWDHSRCDLLAQAKAANVGSSDGSIDLEPGRLTPVLIIES